MPRIMNWKRHETLTIHRFAQYALIALSRIPSLGSITIRIKDGLQDINIYLHPGALLSHFRGFPFALEAKAPLPIKYN